MGTRSDIIVHRADGKWARIYCHWDGNPEHNGKILFEHYNSQEKADALVKLGDLSSLGEEIGTKHDFDWRMSPAKGHRGKKLYEVPEHPDYIRFGKMCSVYGRDRGEKNVAARIFDTLAEAWPDTDTGTEFTYVFADLTERGSGVKSWSVGDPDEGQQTLRGLGAVLRGETEEPKTAIKAFGGNLVIGHR